MTILSIVRRELSEDNTINLSVGILAVVLTGVGVVIAWATWRLSRRRLDVGTVIDQGIIFHLLHVAFYLSILTDVESAHEVPLLAVESESARLNSDSRPRSRSPRPRGYEFAIRLGRSL